MKQSQSYTSSSRSINLPTTLSTQVNLLIIVHFLFFAYYLLSEWRGAADTYWSDGTLNDIVNYNLQSSFELQQLKWQSFTSAFTYQFVHLTVGEFLLSISMLWLFGNVLRQRIGSARTVLLYFAFVVLSALVFAVSHWLFPVFSGPKGVLDGSFSAVLGIMTTTVFFYGKHELKIAPGLSCALWKIFVLAILVGLIFVYKHNIACIIVYVNGIYMGVKAAELLEGQNDEISEPA